MVKERSKTDIDNRYSSKCPSHCNTQLGRGVMIRICGIQTLVFGHRNMQLNESVAGT